MIFVPVTTVPAADEEYPSVFLALLTNRHRGVSGADNFFAVCDDVSPVASSVIFTAETSAQIAETELSSVESTTSFECNGVFIMLVLSLASEIFSVGLVIVYSMVL